MHIHNIIFAGPLQHKNEAGGVVLLFEDLVKKCCNTNNIIDTNSKNYRHTLSMVFFFISQSVAATYNKKEISLHGTARDFKYLGTVLLILHYLFGLKYHTRKFAGNFDDVFKSASPLWKFILKKFLKNSRINYFETKYLVNFFSKYNSNTQWFPNYRASSSYTVSEKYNNKLIYIGHVKKEKGVDKLLQLAGKLIGNTAIDVYGELVGFSAEDFTDNINYRGVLLPEEVCITLSRYSALILLSEREGYPGVVIEAFSVGLPVIASNLLSLQEMIDSESGILVNSDNLTTVIDAIEEIKNNYPHYRQGAIKAFNVFDRDYVLSKYIREISE